MRDNHEGLPEIIDTYERDEHFFCSIAITIGEETRIFEFGINQDSYNAIKRILSMRPFEQNLGAKYRYFFSPRVRRDAKDRSKTYCSIRIEQEKRGKEFDVSAPKPLITNFIWFFQAKDFSGFTHLREITVK